jgi:hypothetical protein
LINRYDTLNRLQTLTPPAAFSGGSFGSIDPHNPSLPDFSPMTTESWDFVQLDSI